MSDDEYVISILAELRRGHPANVTLMDGRRLLVEDIAWGKDAEDDFHHMTTNISPPRAGIVGDYFYTNDIQVIEINGRVVFQTAE
jgi:hypothetical protein